MAKQWGIPQEKARRIAVGATAAGILLVLFLVIILIVQFVRIGVSNSESRRLDEEIEHYNRLIEDRNSDLEYYESELGLYHLALEQGWRTPDKNT